MLVLCFNLLSFGGRELSSKYWWGAQQRPGVLGMCHAGCTGPAGQRDVVCSSANFLSWQCHLLYQNNLGVVAGLLKVKWLLKMFQVCCFPFVSLRWWWGSECTRVYIYMAVYIWMHTTSVSVCAVSRYLGKYLCVCVCPNEASCLQSGDYQACHSGSVLLLSWSILACSCH